MIKSFDKKCTACNACLIKCPQNAIHREFGELGFYYPVVDVKLCVNCGLCDNVCQIDKELPSYAQQKAFAAVNSDYEVLTDSTSGGVFSAVALWIFKHSGVVYGCAYDEQLRPVHIRIDNPVELHRLRGSKYVQSDTGKSYAEAEADLKNGKYVLYSGTPCQVDGLRNFLGKKYERLICIDIICHGVSSAEYFKSYVDYLEMKIDGKIDAYSFRDKKNSGWGLSGTYSGTYSGTGKRFTKRVHYFDNYYYSYFLSGETYRMSCYVCKYAQMSRVGDFTIGDLWGAEGLNLPFGVNNGCSVVLINTDKAEEIWKELSVHMHQIEIEKAVQYNAQLQHPSKYKESRVVRVKEYIEHDSAWIQKNFKKKNYKQNLLGRIKCAVPKPLKNMLLKLRYR